MRTYSHGKKVYSVDMMFAYINLYKPKTSTVLANNFFKNLAYKCWKDEKGICYSPIDVMTSSAKKYDNERKRMKNADLSYPLIMDSKGSIIDGMHRLCKIYMKSHTKKTYVKVYILPDKILKKFYIGSSSNFEKLVKMDYNDMIELFYKRFA